MKLSLIIPFYNEEEQLTYTLGRVRPIMESLTPTYEIIAVDDGSKDDTWKLLSAEAVRDPRIHAIRFSRNFGKEAAICAGLDAAKGDAVILIDGDLQHPPEYIPEMVRLWQEEGYDVVEGVKSSRGKESRLYSWVAGAFYKLFSKMSGVDMDNASDFKLLDKKVVKAWRKLGERNTFFRGLSAWLGFKRYEFPFEVAEREHGRSKWNFRGLWRLSSNALTSFSTTPLSFITSIGLLYLLIALIIGIITLVKYFNGTAVEGFTTVILLLLISGGFIQISLGLIGTYISRIYDEVKERPRYLAMDEINPAPLSEAAPEAGAPEAGVALPEAAPTKQAPTQAPPTGAPPTQAAPADLPEG